MTYAGFDRADCPDLAVMQRLKAETNLVWCGYYLRAPSQPATTWRGKRAALVAQGWGLAPIYVGQQTTGPGSYIVTAAQGAIDGRQASADLRDEGFPAGAYIYLDLENGPPFVAAQQTYVKAWADSVSESGFGVGVYCSFLIAGKVAALLPGARIWVYHVMTTTPHPVGGSGFPAPDPARSGYPQAAIWQHQDEARLTAYGALACDLDSSIYADPSAPGAVAQPQPVAAADVSGRQFPVGSPEWLQAALNALGSRPPLTVDGIAGKATRAAIAAFQVQARIYVDGIAGVQTVAALQAALAHRAG